MEARLKAALSIIQAQAKLEAKDQAETKVRDE